MAAPKWVDIVLIGDERYAVGLAAAILSILHHSSLKCVFWIVDVGLHSHTKLKLQELAEINWIEFDVQLLPRNSSYSSRATWAKLLLSQILPEEVQKVLYVDADTIFLADIAELWQVWEAPGSCGTLLDDPPAAAVGASSQLMGGMPTARCTPPVFAVRDFGLPCGHEKLVSLGWLMSSSYFNAGILLLDVLAFKAKQNDMLQIMQSPITQENFQDQDVLNLIYQGAWQELPFKWNVQGIGTYARDRTHASVHHPALFSDQQCTELEQHPHVVHFTGPPCVRPHDFLNPYVRYCSKPWAYLCQHPYQAEFWKILQSTTADQWQFWAARQACQQQVAQATVMDVLEFADKVQDVHPDFNRRDFLKQLVDELTERLASTGLKE